MMLTCAVCNHTRDKLKARDPPRSADVHGTPVSFGICQWHGCYLSWTGHVSSIADQAVEDTGPRDMKKAAVKGI